MPYKLILTVLIALMLVSPALAQKPSSDQTKLVSLLTKMTDAQTAFDAAALDSIFTADYIEISPVGEFDPREKVLGFYKPELKPPAGKMSTIVEADEYSVRVYGKTAVVIARLTFKITADGKQLPPRGMRVTAVARKVNGTWKIASAQYTGIRPPQPPKPQ